MNSPAASTHGIHDPVASPHDHHAKARFNMVEGQIRTNRVSDAKLLSALSDMPRQIFVPPALASVAYVDKSLRLAPDRYLMEPLVLSRLLQEAVAGPDDKALIIGAGTGYSAAILARLVHSVIALECDDALAAAAEVNLAGVGAGNAIVQTGPLRNGWAPGAPYDIILFDGMIADLPESVSAQLAERGRLVTIRSGEGRSGSGMLYRKLGGAISGRVLFDAVTPYLPGLAPEPAFAF